MKAGEVSYKVYAVISSTLTLDITNAVTGLGWEENENELSSKVTFDLYNATYEKKKLSTIIKLCCPVVIWSNWGDGKGNVATATIQDGKRISNSKEDKYSIVAYDNLYNMQKSQDNVYFAKGKTTKAALTDIFKKWGVNISSYTGANVKHSKILYKNKKLGDIVRGILDEAIKKGGKKSIIRCTDGKVQIVAVGSNSKVYYFNADNSIEAEYSISTSDMVTRVKIVSSTKATGNPKVEATVSKNTSYGIRQKIVTKSKSESLSDAKKEANQELKDHGSPKKTWKVECCDVPPVRKGDKVNIVAGTLNGDYIVKSIQHNAQSGKMNMTVEKLS